MTQLHQCIAKGMVVFVAVAVGMPRLTDASANAAETHQQRARLRSIAERYAGGAPSRDAAGKFRSLLLRRSGHVTAELSVEVDPLGAEQFLSFDRHVDHNLFDVDGNLSPPPGLISENEESPLAHAVAALDAELADAFATIARGRSVSREAVDRLRRRISRLSRHADIRDVEATIFGPRLNEFVDYYLALGSHHQDLRESGLIGGSPPAEEFPGGDIGLLADWCLSNEVAPAIGSEASRHLSMLVRALCEADEVAEEEEWQNRIDRAEDGARTAEIRRQARRAERNDRRARRSGSTTRTRYGSNSRGYDWYWVPGETFTGDWYWTDPTYTYDTFSIPGETTYSYYTYYTY